MDARKLLAGAAALAAIGSSVPAFAHDRDGDDYGRWNRGDGFRHGDGGWRFREGREHEARERFWRERWERAHRPYGGYYDNYYYNGYGYPYYR